MEIVQICNGDIPPRKYGGTQRVVAWLTKGLLELGHKVTLLIDGKTSIEHENLRVIKLPKSIKKILKKSGENGVYKYLPEDYDIVHFHYNPSEEPEFPYVITFHWLGKSRDKFDDEILENTIFVSNKHALNNNRFTYIHHGVDPLEFDFKEKKSDRFLFLSKVSYPPKNVKLAIKLAKDMKFNLDIAGGWRFSISRYLKFHGMVGGTKKYNLLSRSKAMIFPTLCEEPFGLVTIEALASGTPVITSENGAMPEIIKNGINGFRCTNYQDYKKAVNKISKINPVDCRKIVEEKFNYLLMAKNYLEQYESVLSNNGLKKNIGGKNRNEYQKNFR
ncbi:MULTISPECIES: glycosyltransferase [Halanaerobium]|uniref:Glycosyltransferase involved in cell wall bisynthesis n=1 Tax=Halanaerobium kushneri TaxID=56779 RepID=A0A1N7BL37_9FIRM|nr:MULTISPECIES: glycosyltransferase [Halanaerobium]PUU94238.1 MAG: group 1 glycosyl transferase [Halanaerobium sp.]RCW62245.1 glycosyltransferase involved in cell wall biosynthesis [Halanaerobium sp. ST460_2HS_T2]SIR51913.1 Glycosyltransferase involved in cell wall bisynthesis [Halanaerobium kushneri]